MSIYGNSYLTVCATANKILDKTTMHDADMVYDITFNLLIDTKTALKDVFPLHTGLENCAINLAFNIRVDAIEIIGSGTTCTGKMYGKSFSEYVEDNIKNMSKPNSIVHSFLVYNESATIEETITKMHEVFMKDIAPKFNSDNRIPQLHYFFSKEGEPEILSSQQKLLKHVESNMMPKSFSDWLVSTQIQRGSVSPHFFTPQRLNALRMNMHLDSTLALKNDNSKKAKI